MLGKGLLLVGGTIVAASALASGPLLAVSAPFVWWGTTTYSVSAAGVAGLGLAALVGASTGKVAGTTGSALIVQGMDDMSRELVDRLSKDKNSEEQ